MKTGLAERRCIPANEKKSAGCIIMKTGSAERRRAH
jgi:hypothetical protein